MFSNCVFRLANVKWLAALTTGGLWVRPSALFLGWTGSRGFSERESSNSSSNTPYILYLSLYTLEKKSDECGIVKPPRSNMAPVANHIGSSFCCRESFTVTVRLGTTILPLKLSHTRLSLKRDRVFYTRFKRFVSYALICSTHKWSFRPALKRTIRGRMCNWFS